MDNSVGLDFENEWDFVGWIEMYVLGGAWLCLHTSSSCCLVLVVGALCGLVKCTRGCMSGALVLCSGRLHAMASICYLQDFSMTCRTTFVVAACCWLLCWLPTLWNAIEIWSPFLPTMASPGCLGALSCPCVSTRVALLRLGNGSSGASVLSAAVFVCGSWCSFTVCPSYDRYHRQMTLVARRLLQRPGAVSLLGS